MRREQAKHMELFDRERNAAAVWVSSKTGETLDEVLRKIQNQDVHPTAEQNAFLVHFVLRLKLKWLTLEAQALNRSHFEKFELEGGRMALEEVQHIRDPDT